MYTRDEIEAAFGDYVEYQRVQDWDGYCNIFTPDAVDLPAIDADERFFVPAYYGPYGGRAIDLDDPAIDWAEIAELADASYRRVAPKRLLAQLDARTEYPYPPAPS